MTVEQRSDDAELTDMPQMKALQVHAAVFRFQLDLLSLEKD